MSDLTRWTVGTTFCDPDPEQGIWVRASEAEAQIAERDQALSRLVLELSAVNDEPIQSILTRHGLVLARHGLVLAHDWHPASPCQGADGG